MPEFGRELRRLRTAQGWRQQDLVDAIGGAMARSTLANVETGREPPTERLWDLLGSHLPAWLPALEASYRSARAVVGEQRPEAGAPGGELAVHPGESRGDVRLESLQIVYTFRHSRSPEEIIEIRRVRAQRSGVDQYPLRTALTDTAGFEVEQEGLWGGRLETPEHRFLFDRRLRRGQCHDFGVRSWVERDRSPDTKVVLSVPMPTDEAAIQLNFTGPETPATLWSWGPKDGGRELGLSPQGNVSLHVTHPVPGAPFGISWRW